MSDLMYFFEEFQKQEFSGVHICANSHTLRLCCRESVIPQVVISYVVHHCPSTCRYFISDYPWGPGLYLNVYDDDFDFD